MLIKLNVVADAVCAQIFAWAENEEQSWSHKGQEVRSVKIWHNDQQQSINLNDSNFSNLVNCDNDYYVEFKSKIFFKQFCEQFAASEYNDPSCYHYYTHNCANAACFALKIADINLPVGFLKLTTLAPGFFLKIPTPVLTPIDLYHTARKYKLQELQHFSNKVCSSIKEKALALSFWAKSAKNEKKEYVDVILANIQKNMKTRPHHMELYLEILTQTYALLNTESTEEEQMAYFGFSKRFADRTPHYLGQARREFLNLVALCYGLLWIKYDVKFRNNLQFVASFFKHTIRTPNDNWPYGIVFGLLIAMHSIRLIYTLDQGRHIPAFERQDTPLSWAMRGLARECYRDLRDKDVAVEQNVPGSSLYLK